MKANFVVFGLIIIVLLGAGYYAWQTQNVESVKNSDAARSLVGSDEAGRTAFTDLEGNPVDLEQYAGQVRIVNSWATWCPFCIDELPDLEKLAAEMNDGVVIAINRSEPAAKQQAYLNRLGEFNHIIFVKDESDSFYQSIGGFSMPETIFYRHDGSVAVHQRGLMSFEQMQEYYQKTITTE